LKRHGTRGRTPAKAQLRKTKKPKRSYRAKLALDGGPQVAEIVRLTGELNEALERQRATADILAAISRSKFELQSILQGVVDTASRLCRADASVIFRLEGGVYRFAAGYSLIPAYMEHERRNPISPGPGTLIGRAAMSRQVVLIEDAWTDPLYEQKAVVGVGRSMMGVPLMHNGEPIGVIGLSRSRVVPFLQREIDLVTTFADQAVIAIENARLLSELRESLAQQTATSEVLSVISSSPGELKPVFDAILTNAARLCEAQFGNLLLYEEGAFRFVAMHNVPAIYAERWQRETLVRPSSLAPIARAAATKNFVHIVNLKDDPAYLQSDPPVVSLADVGGARTLVVVPMVKDAEVIGALGIFRQEVRPFTDNQIDLVRNFAAQAVIAIENTRLLNELRESLAQQMATSEVLQIISSSPRELQPVFEAMLANAAGICEVEYGFLWLAEADGLRPGAYHGLSPELEIAFPRDRILRPDPDLPLARAIRSKDVVHVLDVREEPGYIRRYPPFVPLIDIGGARTLLLVPMLKEGALVGMIALYRKEIRPFNDKQIALVQNFASQAVIAIDNARLLTELRESLAQQTATAEVLRIISSSPGDLAPVFESMLANATRLCEAKFGNLFLHEENGFRYVAMHGAPSDYLALGKPLVVLGEHPHTPLAEAVRTKQPIHAADLSAERCYLEHDPRIVALVDIAGARTILTVPMLKDSEVVGAIAIYRQEVRPFTDKQIELVKNFAAQAVIAIENTRLLNELRQRTNDLTEALEQQTATSTVLGVISSSPGELDPVFKVILENAAHICQAQFGTLNIYDGSAFRTLALHNPPPQFAMRLGEVIRPHPESGLAYVAGTKQIAHIDDIRTRQPYLEGDKAVVDLADLAGARTLLIVPMLKEGKLIGTIAIYRQEVRPFTDRQIELVRNFAAQAVIAIENARLLNELRQRTDELSRSVEELRALGEVSQAVNSTLDLETVLSSIVAKAVQLSGTEAGAIYVFDEPQREFHLRATYGMEQELIDALTQQHIGLDDFTVARALAQSEPIQVADLREVEPSAVNEIILRAGFCALLVALLMREDEIIGILVVRRRTPGAFAQNTVDLIKTFAAQSALAIQNARLFHEIEDKSQQLEVASQHKSQFLANMSHELRTPLNAILGYTELILDNSYGEAPDRMRTVLERVQTNGKHLLGLINDVLDLSKIEAGQLSLDLVDYSFEQVAHTVYTAVESLAAEKKLKFTAEVAPNLPRGHGDDRRLTQVLLNLVGNAIKFTDTGEVSIKVSVADGSFNVAVRDTGPGISAANHAKLFQEFQQADNSIARKKGGTGLGLAISKRIIEMHGGRIWVDSMVGQGSTFSFTVPVRVTRQVAAA
jgi:GAF domain-containing protein